MPREKVTRDSDGTTIDLAKAQAEEYNVTAKTKRVTLYDSTGTAISSGNKLPVDAVITTGDIEIGAVEIKNATDDTRAVVKTDGTNNALVVVQNTVPKTTVAVSQSTTENQVQVVELPDAVTLGDTLSNPTTTMVGSNMLIWDGTNWRRLLTFAGDAVTLSFLRSGTGVWNGSAWDRLKGDTTNGAYVNVKDSVLPTGASTSANQQTASTTPVSYNVTLTNANAEYSQLLTTGTKELRFRCRTSYDIRYAWETGKVATPTANYFTLPAGCDYILSEVNLTSKTIYLASATAGVVVCIEEWS